MSWRKVLVKGLVLIASSCLAVGLGLYAMYTNPETVRRLLIEKLGVRFLHTTVDLESARLRLLGGIAVRELRLSRSHSLDRRDFLYVPDAVIYHDKEQVLDGKVAIRKVELIRPQLRIVRERDGTFNLQGILGSTELGERLPTLVVRQGTIIVEDRALTPGTSLLEIHDLQLTILNDPLPTLQVEGTGRSDVLGPVKLRATVGRATLAAQLRLECPAIPVGPDLLARLGRYSPRTLEHLGALKGTAAVEASIHLPQGAGPCRYEVDARLMGGECRHPLLPAPLKQVHVEAHLSDGTVGHARLRAACGEGRVEITLKDLQYPSHSARAAACDLSDLDRLVRELDLRVERLPMTAEVLARLPEDLRFLEAEYQPRGPVSVSYTYRRAGPGARPLKEWVVRPEGMTGLCDVFPYPLEGVTGTVRLDTLAIPLRNIRLDLHGMAGGRPVQVQGRIKGEKKTSEVALEIQASGLLLDHRVMAALPPRVRQVAGQFLPKKSREVGLHEAPMGHGDVVAVIQRTPGQTQIRKKFTITFHGASVYYDQFPYDVEGVEGELVVHPDQTWECHGFRGRHGRGEIRVDGHSSRVQESGVSSSPTPDPRLLTSGPGRGLTPAPPPEHVHLTIQGMGMRVDRDLEDALAPAHLPERQSLRKAVRALALSGNLEFKAEVIDHPGQPQDIDVAVEVHGCTMRPTFFDYALHHLCGKVRYARGRVHVSNLRARHGTAQLTLGAGLIQLKPGGGFLAWLRGLHGANLPADDDLLAALPEPIRKVLAGLKLTGPVGLDLAYLTLDQPGEPGNALKVWWGGGVTLREAAFKAGVQAQGVTGVFHCHGHHDGQQMHGLFGDLLLQRALVLGQPLSNLHARLEIPPEKPNVVEVRDLKADLFGGTVGGEAHLKLGQVLRYEVDLEAVQMQLDRFGKHNLGAAGQRAQLQGAARAALHLTGEGGDLLTLKGNGRLDVPQGKMGELPLLLDLVKAVGLRVPDRTAFEQAHMVFAVEGPQVRVQQLDLYGNAVSVRGQGTVDLDGNNVSLDFSATPGRFAQVLPPVLDAIPQAISQQILKIKMRGRLGQGGAVRFEKELVPGVLEPIKRAVSGQ
jgi:hypothetical protein